MSRSEPYTVNEIKALLLAQEERLDKHRLLDPLASLVAVVISWNPVHSRTDKSKNKFNNFRGYRGSSRSGSFHGPHSSNYRTHQHDSWNYSSTSSRPTCQIYKKPVHTAEFC